jgi:hypothetical protein
LHAQAAHCTNRHLYTHTHGMQGGEERKIWPPSVRLSITLRTRSPIHSSRSSQCLSETATAAPRAPPLPPAPASMRRSSGRPAVSRAGCRNSSLRTVSCIRAAGAASSSAASADRTAAALGSCGCSPSSSPPLLSRAATPARVHCSTAISWWERLLDLSSTDSSLLLLLPRPP